MPGQFNTLRDEDTGQPRKTTSEEHERLMADAEPPPRPGAVTERDVAFLAEHGGGPPLADLPERRPAVLPTPPAEAGARSEPPSPPIQEAAQLVDEVAAGAKAGGVAGAGGAAAVFLANKAAEAITRPTDSLIGTVEGNVVNQRDDSAQTLRQMFDLQQQVARIGQPVLGAVDTTAIDSRI